MRQRPHRHRPNSQGLRAQPRRHATEAAGARPDAERARSLAGGDGPVASSVSNRQAIAIDMNIGRGSWVQYEQTVRMIPGLTGSDAHDAVRGGCKAPVLGPGSIDEAEDNIKSCWFITSLQTLNPKP